MLSVSKTSVFFTLVIDTEIFPIKIIHIPEFHLATIPDIVNCK
jgi:hypothetical protein